MATSKRVQVVLPETLYKRLLETTKKTSMPQSLIIRKALNGYLNFCDTWTDSANKLDTTPDVAGKYWK